jgi:hypothetical protein
LKKDGGFSALAKAQSGMDFSYASKQAVTGY